MSDESTTLRVPAAQSFTLEHLKALDLLKQHGTAVGDTPEEERIFTDLVAAGFATKEGSDYVYTGSREEHQLDQESATSGAPQNSAKAETKTAFFAPSALLHPETDHGRIVLNPGKKPRPMTGRAISGIGGWLLLPALGLILSPVFIVSTILQSLSLLQLQLETALKAALIWEIVCLSAIVLFQVYVARAFFGRKSDAPHLVIVLLLARVAYNIINWVMTTSILRESSSANGIVQTMICAGIWIPYFLMSKRVKATFVIEETLYFGMLNLGATSKRVNATYVTDEAIDNGIWRPITKEAAHDLVSFPPTPPRQSETDTSGVAIDLGKESGPMSGDKSATKWMGSAWALVRFMPKQKLIICAGITCLGFLACYVPWTYTINTSHVNSEKPAGYRLIFDPPKPEANTGAFGVKVDVPRLIIPMAVVVSATIAGAVLTREKTRKQGQPVA